MMDRNFRVVNQGFLHEVKQNQKGNESASQFFHLTEDGVQEAWFILDFWFLNVWHVFYNFKNEFK
jgi:uncharacterized protein YwgA